MVRLATSSGSPLATHLPLKGKARAKPLPYRPILSEVVFQAGALQISAVQSLPLEGKVSAQLTDEVFIKSNTVLSFRQPPVGRAMLGLGRRPIRVENGICAIATARLCPATVFGDYHFLNDRATKNNAAVGASIARPTADRRGRKM